MIFKSTPAFILTLLIVYTSGNTLQLNDKYLLSWEVVGEKEIIFEVTVETPGFIGFGLSPNGAMGGADIVIGGVWPNGTAYLSDRHGEGNSLPVIDKHEDYTLIHGLQNGTHTNMKFSRLLDTCDDEDFKITSATFKLIWSYGETDSIGYHGPDNRGSKTVNLLDPEMPQSDLDKFTLWTTNAKTLLPAKPTTYWCTIHKTPSLSSMHHMIGFDAIISNELAQKHTHHIDMYKCASPEGQDATELFGPLVGQPGADCYDPDAPEYSIFQHCEWIQYGWAIGGEITLWPDNIGFQFLGDEYFMMEIHYDNPESKADVQFEAGMQVYYTEELREITAAQFLVGSIISFSQMVPPNEEKFITTAHCHADCTNEFPPEGITVFNMLLHSHKSGQAMRVRHFRNGTELPWIISDDTYDFNYQQNRPVQEFKLLRGDHITVECTYDTTWKNGVPVIGGRATTEEMCIAFFNYYPRMPDLVECNSEMPEKELLGFFGLEEYELGEGEEDPTITLPEAYKGRKFSEIVQNFNWTQERRDEYQRKARYELHDGVCDPLGSTFKTSFPEFDKVYVPPQSCEPSTTTEPATTTPDNEFSTASIISRLNLSLFLVLSGIILMAI